MQALWISKKLLILNPTMKHVFSLKKVFVFSQWSRKSYAVFASMGKVIKIAQVSIATGDKGLIKKTSLKRALNLFSFPKRN